MVRTPYTYLLRHVPTGKLYYGVRWAKGCHPSEFWQSYHTSSKTVALYRTLFGDDCWEHEVRRIFKTAKAAQRWEHKVLRRMRVLEHQEIWLNRTTCKAILNEDKSPGFSGLKHSKQTRQQMSIKHLGNQNNKGKKVSQQTKDRNKVAALTMWSNRSKDYRLMFGMKLTQSRLKRG